MNRDLVVIIVGRVLQIVISLVSVRLLTTFLTPEEVGSYYLIAAFLAFFNLVLLNPPSMYFGRHLLQWERSKNLLNALSVFGFWILVVAFISIPVSIYTYEILGYKDKFELNVFLVYIFSALIISTVHRNVLYGCNTLGFRKEFVKYLIATLFIGLGLSVAIVSYFYPHALGWIFGVVLSELIMLAFVFRFFIQKNGLDLRKIRNTLTKEKIIFIFSFSLPIGVTTFLLWGQSIAYRFIIDYKYSAEVLGYVGVGLGVSTAIFSALESISMQYFNPIFLKDILDANEEQRAQAWNNIAKLIVPVYILTFFFTVTMSDFLISILVAKKFHASYIYTMFGAGIEFFRVMTNLLYNVSQSEHKTAYTIKPYLIGFILSLGILIAFNFKESYFMIPLVLAFGQMFIFCFMYLNMKKLLDIKYDLSALKALPLAAPFFLVLVINSAKTFSFMQNVFIVLGFGLYFLGATFYLTKYQQKG